MNRRAVLAGLAGALLVGTVTVVTTTQGRGAQPLVARGQGATPEVSAVSPPTTVLKAPVAGLLTRDGPPQDALAPAVSGWVVNADWSELQPTAGGPLAAGNVIDRAITEARRAAPAVGTAALEIRVFAGIHAPDWAKSLGGPPVAVRDPQSGQGGTAGRFWTPEFGQAYARLQEELAAAYDAVPEIREVTAARCTTVFSEPFIRDLRDPATVSALLAAGFTPDADARCQREQIDAHDVWRQTRTTVAFNPYERLEPNGTATPDLDFSRQMMAYCRERLKDRCVLENNSVRWPLPGAGALYAALASFGPPLAFQTATQRRVGDLVGAIRYCISLGAASVELPEGADVPVADLVPLSDGLRANAARSPG